MKKILPLFALSTLAAGCTSIQVQPIDSSLNPDKICIEENPKVIVRDFLDVVTDRIEYHGIHTEIYNKDIPEDCEYTMTYTALKTWDMGTYLHHAELRLSKNGDKVGYAEYHLNGKGGLSLTKWKGTKSKMDPVVDELLGK
ncbi:MAG: Sbal_3080 family lipoprotein [Halomonas sp.]|nr:Sbal_3080 family lipoprotein [Halomonas sp.]MDN6298077.1 Sbal_3080 family lipoprotein [Halomonas sp.]MDN6314972.1 Sbal_3080 family lipoprotein [Halomonas sp.]MDN6335726.1 Sbal_3080 family lipoprotein [Halomonas sp.]